MDIAATLRAERLALVERLTDLSDADWDKPSLCGGWTVRHVLAHLTTPFSVSPAAMGLRFLKARGIGAAMDATARDLAQRPTAQLLETLRNNASSQFHPPGMPMEAPLTDSIVHSADIRWGLGDDHDDWGDPIRLRPVLDFLLTPRAALGFVSSGRLRGLCLTTTDQDWSHGQGAEVQGPSLALAMGTLGRTAALPHLIGDGVQQLR